MKEMFSHSVLSPPPHPGSECRVETGGDCTKQHKWNAPHTAPSHCLCRILPCLPTSQPVSSRSSSTVNVSVARTHTCGLLVELTSNPQKHILKAACKESEPPPPPFKVWRGQRAPLSQGTLEPLEGHGVKRSGPVGGTHIGSFVFLCLTCPPPSLWHVPLLLQPPPSTQTPLSPPTSGLPRLIFFFFGSFYTSCLLYLFFLPAL